MSHCVGDDDECPEGCAGKCAGESLGKSMLRCIQAEHDRVLMGADDYTKKWGFAPNDNNGERVRFQMRQAAIDMAARS